MGKQLNEKEIQSVSTKMERMKEELAGRPVDADTIAEVLETLHPDDSPDALHDAAQEIVEGVEQLYQVSMEQMLENSAQTLGEQMEGMTEEQQKGFLCQLFDSTKQSDEAVDSEIANAKVDGTDLAQMSVEELQTIVSEQIVNSVQAMAGDILESNMEEIADMDLVSLQTKEDAILLAAAQYSEALEGNIPFEYTKIPRVLGQCAAAQTRIVSGCNEVVHSDLSEDEKHNKIVEIITGVLGFLGIVAFCVVLGMVGGALYAGVVGAVEALLGTGIIALVADILLIYPTMFVSIGVVTGAVGLVALATEAICELLKAAAPKIKKWYHKLVRWIRGENSADENEENYDSADENWDYDDLEEEDEEEDEEGELAYT